MTTEFDAIERLIYCLQAGFPHPIIAALLALADGDIDTEDAWQVWHDSDHWSSHSFYLRRAEFADAVENVTGRTVVACYECSGWSDADETVMVADGDNVCDPCLADAYTSCGNCGEYHLDGRLTDVADRHGNGYCQTCLDGHCEYCEYCDGWFRGDGHYDTHEEEEEDCDCEAPHRQFQFPANGHGTVLNDERLNVTLPAGTIDEVGLRRIHTLLVDNLLNDQHPDPWTVVAKAITAVGDVWQAKKGNFTRRLSRELYANHGKVKVPEGVLSEVGNLARQHSSESSEWSIEFTRDLNQSARDFCHSGSCWWGGYHESRCALKQWGGMGLRTFEPDDNESDDPTGRAWVQPLNENLEPTHDALNAHAYVIYNAYGALGGYQAARIVAHLSSKTYRKVDLSSDPQYINGNWGYLVADEHTCTNTDTVHFTSDAHSTHDARTINQEVPA